MKRLFTGIAAVALAVCAGCGPAPVAIAVSQLPVGAGPPTLARGKSMTLSCAAARVGGRYSRQYRGAVEVRVEADGGIEASPSAWEGEMNPEDYAGVGREVTVRAAADAPLGRHVLKVVVRRADGSSVSRDFEFEVTPQAEPEAEQAAP